MRTLFLCALALSVALCPLRSEAAGRTCLTPSPSPDEARQVLLRTTDAGGRYLNSCPAGGTVAVALHVLCSGSLGRLTSDQILAQMSELNLDFAPSGYQFVLAALDYTDNSAWFGQPLTYATPIRITLALDPVHTANVYTCDLPGEGAGFSFYPWQFPEGSVQHSIFIDYATVPGVGAPPYNLGRTLTHEMGHYFGLFHTFENGCNDPGDDVADTPDEAAANYGCPEGADSCPSPGLDPIHDYMDYTDDACYTEFTLGQMTRMCAILGAYRPDLVGSGPTPARLGSWGALKVRYR